MKPKSKKRVGYKLKPAHTCTNCKRKAYFRCGYNDPDLTPQYKCEIHAEEWFKKMHIIIENQSLVKQLVRRKK